MARACLEVWSDYPAAGGTPLAPIAFFSSGTAEHSVDNTGRLTVNHPVRNNRGSELWWAEVPQAGRVLRHFDAYGDLHYWRINRVRRGRGGELENVQTIEARSPLMDLVWALIRQRQAGGPWLVNLGVAGSGATPAQYRDTYIMPALAAIGMDWVNVGVWDEFRAILSSWNGFNAQELLVELASKTGLESDLRVEADDQWYLDHTVIGSGKVANPCGLRRNLITIAQDETDTNFYTALYPTGIQPQGEPDVSDRASAAFEVVSFEEKAGPVTEIVLQDRAGGPGPCAFANQFGGHGLPHLPDCGLLFNDGTFFQILSCDPATQIFVVDGAAAPPVGFDCEIRLWPDRAHNIIMFNPAAVAQYGYRQGDLPDDELRGERNYVPNPTMGDWSNPLNPGLPDGWTSSAPSTASAYDRTLTVDATGEVNGNQTGVTEVAVRGLPADYQIFKGDLMEFDGGFPLVVDEYVGVSPTGTAIVKFLVQGNYTDGQAITLRKRILEGNGSRYAIHTHMDVPIDFLTPDFFLPCAAESCSVQVQFGLTILNETNAQITLETSGVGMLVPNAILERTDQTILLNSLEVEQIVLEAWEQRDYVLRGTTTITQDEMARLRIDVARDTQTPGPVQRCSTWMRWVMVHVGGQRDVPVVWGSHGTPIHQLGNLSLARTSTPPMTYDIQMTALGQLGCFNADVEYIRKGYTVPVSVAGLGEFDTRALVVREDMAHSENTTVELGTRLPRLSDSLKNQRYFTQRLGDLEERERTTGKTVRPAVEETGAGRAITRTDDVNQAGGALVVAPAPAGSWSL